MISRGSKALLTRIGANLSRGSLIQLNATLNYLRIGQWMKENNLEFEKRLSSREAVWDAMLTHCASKKILYLEFGVAYGNSMRYWSERLTHPESILHGFDSFEGMPEDGGPWSKGQFATRGNFPIINDPRVRFFKGWFNESLPNYTPPAHNQLVLNMDADLYSSTSYVLQHLGALIKPGTLIYFDEMNHVDHEPRAFAEIISSQKLKFRPLYADTTLAHASFECIN